MPTGSRQAAVGPADRPEIDASTRRTLERWARAATSPQRLARRSRNVLLAADGCPNREIARRTATSPQTVRLWVSRFREGGVAALDHDAPGRGRKPSIGPETVQAVLTLLRALPPGPNGTACVRRIARELGLSPASVHRGLKRDSVQNRGAH
jgi:transposase